MKRRIGRMLALLMLLTAISGAASERAFPEALLFSQENE